MIRTENRREFLFECLFLLFVTSFFFSIGTDYLSQIHAKVWYGAILFFFFLLLRNQIQAGLSKNIGSLTAPFFLGFIIFELGRSFWGSWHLVLSPAAGDPETIQLFQRYIVAPLNWSFYLGLFALSYSFFVVKRRVKHLSWVVSGCSFVLALNAIPPPLLHGIGALGYVAKDGSAGFFHPLFYFNETITKYLISRYTHPNYTGDVIALGFFPALGLLIYALQQFVDQRKAPQGTRRLPLSSIGLPITMIMTGALAITLIFSRGTMVSLGLTFMLFLLVSSIKFHSRTQLILGGIVFFLILGFLTWAVNMRGVWEEIQTLKGALDQTQETSFSVNREGARRALGIYHAYPLWGVGTDGYEKVSVRFATPNLKLLSESLTVVKDKSMCHYLQLLAEEGLGAYLYFLFVLFYFSEIVWKLFKTKSRFKFLMGLSFAASVLMIMGHASFNFLMQQFSISAPVYIFMGTSLAILRHDFQHD